METYNEFLNRINSFEKKKPEFGEVSFIVNQSLAQKVDSTNKFRQFYGDTVVFGLDDDIKARLCDYVDILYSSVPQCFCERLVPHTFHMTLHDLSNSAVLGDVAEELFVNEIKVAEIMGEFKQFKGTEIRLKSKCIFNMVNTSLVLGLYPIDEINHRILTQMYSLLDGVKKLSYPLTPHITLAYYNVNGFEPCAAAALDDAVERINDTLDFCVTLRDLYYQKFVSMNNYINIIKLL